MAKLLTDSDEEVFGKVSTIATDLRTRVFETANSFKPSSWYRERMDNLTGCFMYLSERLGRLKAMRNLNSINAYVQAKLDSSVAGEKFTSAAGDRAAEFAVKEVAEAVTIVESYLVAAEQGILTCKKDVDAEEESMKREQR